MRNEIRKGVVQKVPSLSTSYPYKYRSNFYKNFWSVLCTHCSSKQRVLFDNWLTRVAALKPYVIDPPNRISDTESSSSSTLSFGFITMFIPFAPLPHHVAEPLCEMHNSKKLVIAERLSCRVFTGISTETLNKYFNVHGSRNSPELFYLQFYCNPWYIKLQWKPRFV